MQGAFPVVELQPVNFAVKPRERLPLPFYTIAQLYAELERRGSRRHPNPHGVVVPLGKVWIHPDGVTRIVIPRAVDGVIPTAIVMDLLERHDVPEPKPNN